MLGCPATTRSPRSLSCSFPRTLGGQLPFPPARHPSLGLPQCTYPPLEGGGDTSSRTSLNGDHPPFPTAVPSAPYSATPFPTLPPIVPFVDDSPFLSFPASRGSWFPIGRRRFCLPSPRPISDLFENALPLSLDSLQFHSSVSGGFLLFLRVTYGRWTSTVNGLPYWYVLHRFGTSSPPYSPSTAGCRGTAACTPIPPAR